MKRSTMLDRSAAQEAMSRALEEERRAAIGTYVQALVIANVAGEQVCAACEPTQLAWVEAEAAAEYRRGMIRGLEIAMEMLDAIS